MRYCIMVCLFAAICCSMDINVPADYSTMQEAVANAVSGDRIILADGIYSDFGYSPLPKGSKNFNEWYIDKSLQFVSAGGSSNCIIDMSESVYLNYVTTAFRIRYSPNAPSVSFEGITFTGALYSVIYCEKYTNLTLTDCVFVNNDCSSNVIFFDGSNLQINNCTFTNNYAEYDGGVLYLTSNTGLANGSVLLADCIFRNNKSGRSGGVIFAKTFVAPFNISGCEFSGNSSLDGGALYLTTNSGLVIENCKFVNNYAVNKGGAIKINSCSGETITGCEITGNYLTDSLSAGGAIYVTYGDINFSKLILTDSIVSSNRAVKQGGAICAANSGATMSYKTHIYIDNCDIIGNQNLGYQALGGGIYTDCALNITSSKIRFNYSGLSSAMHSIYDPGSSSVNTKLTGSLVFANYNSDASGNPIVALGLELDGCTIVENYNSNVQSYNDPMYFAPVYAKSLKSAWTVKAISNSIIYGNIPILDVVCDNVSDSLIQKYANGILISEIPMFAADGYSLTYGSPCINAGPLSSNYPKDCDGKTRMIGGRVDIGAAEYKNIADLDIDGKVDLNDYRLFTQQWIAGDADVSDIMILAENWLVNYSY